MWRFQKYIYFGFCENRVLFETNWKLHQTKLNRHTYFQKNGEIRSPDLGAVDRLGEIINIYGNGFSQKMGRLGLIGAIGSNWGDWV